MKKELTFRKGLLGVFSGSAIRNRATDERLASLTTFIARFLLAHAVSSILRRQRASRIDQKVACVMFDLIISVFRVWMVRYFLWTRRR